MTTNRTFTMIKPDAVENGYIGKILDMITEAGFEIKAMKYTRLSQKQAEDFMQFMLRDHFTGVSFLHDFWTYRCCYFGEG